MPESLDNFWTKCITPMYSSELKVWSRVSLGNEILSC